MKAAGAVVCALVLIGVLVLVANMGRLQPSVVSDPNLKISDIRGDTLGMPIAAYKKKHPYECSGPGEPASWDTCAGGDTYAGASALKSTFFTRGALYRIQYMADAQSGPQICDALKEKYGDPGRNCSGNEGSSCTWSNGKATIRFYVSKKNAVVTFSDEELSHQATADYDEQKARERKSDQ